MDAYFSRFCLVMTKSQALSASHQGRCDEDVEHLRNVPKISKQLQAIKDDDLQAELREYGAWNEEELANREDNERRIVWIAAGNIKEGI